MIFYEEGEMNTRSNLNAPFKFIDRSMARLSLGSSFFCDFILLSVIEISERLEQWLRKCNDEWRSAFHSQFSGYRGNRKKIGAAKV